MQSPTLESKLSRLSNWFFACESRLLTGGFNDEVFHSILKELFDLHCEIVKAICDEKIKELQCESAQNSLSQTTI